MKEQAIFNLYPSAVTVGNGGEFVLDKDQKPITIDEKKVEEEYKKLKAEYDALQYQRDRAISYPSIDDVVVALAEKEEGDAVGGINKSCDTC